MVAREAETVMRRYWEEGWNQRKWATIDEVVAENHVDHNALPGLPAGREGQKALMSTYFTAFPDLKIVTEDILVDGENVVTRWTAIGTHNGPLMGIPPSGKSMKVAGISIDRVINGQMVEGWYQFDALGMFQQVGAIPAIA